MRRFAHLSVLVVGAFVVAALAGFSSAVAGDEEPNKPCAATKFETPEVEKACKDGGQKAAKDLMKKVSDYTKTHGKEIKCKGCHSDMKTYALTPDGGSELKRILKEMSAPAKAPATPAPAAPAPKPAGK